MRILVTGSAGFIGFHLAERLLRDGHDVAGLDNFNDYYSVRLKRDRHALLVSEFDATGRFSFHENDICERVALERVFSEFEPECVINLAAQAGVRYSLTHPFEYQKSNLEGFLSVLECCRHAPRKPRLIYASSSSVYGGNRELPFSEDQAVDHPVSLYAATKKANELMAHVYTHLYGIQTIGLRFFTVYGPWYRPDMAMYLFADAMTRGDPIKVFNRGEMSRDFTYVDDIVEGIVRCMTGVQFAPYEIFNIGNNRPERLLDMIGLLAKELCVTPQLELLPMQAGDVPATWASIERLNAKTGYAPRTSLSEGIPKFVAWYRSYVQGRPLRGA
jgi:UDP-glucuronate 4-epimerase